MLISAEPAQSWAGQRLQHVLLLCRLADPAQHLWGMAVCAVEAGRPRGALITEYMSNESTAQLVATGCGGVGGLAAEFLQHAPLQLQCSSSKLGPCYLLCKRQAQLKQCLLVSLASAGPFKAAQCLRHAGKCAACALAWNSCQTAVVLHTVHCRLLSMALSMRHVTTPVVHLVFKPCGCHGS
jgi:hypothetical protein